MTGRCCPVCHRPATVHLNAGWYVLAVDRAHERAARAVTGIRPATGRRPGAGGQQTALFDLHPESA